MKTNLLVKVVAEDPGSSVVGLHHHFRLRSRPSFGSEMEEYFIQNHSLTVNYRKDEKRMVGINTNKSAQSVEYDVCSRMTNCETAEKVLCVLLESFQIYFNRKIVQFNGDFNMTDLSNCI